MSEGRSSWTLIARLLVLVALSACETSEDSEPRAHREPSPHASTSADQRAVELKAQLRDGPDGRCLEVGIEEAIKGGWLTADFFGTGEYMGESVGVRVVATGTAGVRLCLVLKRAIGLAPGSVIRSPDGKQVGSVSANEHQRMVVTGPLRPIEPPIMTHDREEEKYELEWRVSPTSSVSLGAEIGSESFAIATGYCLDEFRREPVPGMSLRVGDVDIDLVDIDMGGVSAVLAKSDGYSPGIVQDAIWAVRHPSDDFRPCQKPSRDTELVALIKATGLDAVRYPGIGACLR